MEKLVYVAVLLVTFGRPSSALAFQSKNSTDRMSTAVKLAIAATIVSSVTAYMAYLGMTASWKYYLTVDECLADAPALVSQRMRVSGKVALDSLEITPGRELASFKLCGTDRQLPVRCVGPLPDNLAEEMDVVVEGLLDEAGLLHGDQVLTRCASKYKTESRTAVRPQTSTEERLR
jgi:cytochrome c-type biogenesis protein CcmE